MVSILDNKTIAELVVKNGDDYQKINPETLATIVEDVTGTTTETEKTVQEHIDNKSIHLTAEDVEDFTKDNVDKKLIYPILKYNNSLIKQNHDLLLELSKVKNVKNIIQNYK